MSTGAAPPAAAPGGQARIRLPRALHPGAWWLWALGLAVAASQTTNPLLVVLLVAVAGVVVANRRGAAPWARGFHVYLVIGVIVIALRVVFRALLDGQPGGTVLVTLPEIPLGELAAGIRIGGPVTAESLLAALADGLRLAALLCAIGAANTLADPKRLLKALPAALHEVGVVVVVALSVAPQLIASLQRVRRARRLRAGRGRGFRALRAILIPVLEDALDRSLALAASMDSRGYGRSRRVPRRTRLATGVLLIGGLCGVCVGTYGLLDQTTPAVLGGPMVAAGAVCAITGLIAAGRRVPRTVYRPDPWGGPEWVVAACGVVVAAGFLMIAATEPATLGHQVRPLAWPQLPLLPTAILLVGLVPALAAPVPPDRPGGQAQDAAELPAEVRSEVVA